MNLRRLTFFTVILVFSYVLLNPFKGLVKGDAGVHPDLFSFPLGIQFAGDPQEYQDFLPVIINSRTSCSYYVAPNGADTNQGTLSAPWKSLQYASDAAILGSTICVREGTYMGFKLTRPNLTFAAYPGETVNVIGNGSDIHTIDIQKTTGAVIRDLTVRDNLLQYGTAIHVEDASNITISGNVLRDNQGFGVVLKNVSNVIVEKNYAYHNGNAIEVRYGSAGVILRNNNIYQNDRVVDSGRGGVGITFYRTTGPVTAANNLIWGNHTPSPNPEGVGFEVYAASNVIMTGNVLWDNQTILETGTDGAPCSNLTFTRNIAYRINWQQGLILRCASNSLFAHNTFDGLDSYVFDLSHYHGSYGASIEGLKIVNNIAINGRVYVFDTFPLPASVVIDNNLVYNPPGSPAKYGSHLAYVEGFGNTDSFSEFQAWTGYDKHGVNLNPLLENPEGRDYHLQSGSPAIDRGMDLNESYIGTAPDLGRYEFIPESNLAPLIPNVSDQIPPNGKIYRCIDTVQ